MRKNTSRLVSEGVRRDATTRPRSPMGSSEAFDDLHLIAILARRTRRRVYRCRYEFIVYIERASSSYTQTNCTGGKLQRLYSSNGSCIVACAPLHCTRARFIVHAYTYINVLTTWEGERQGTTEWMVGRARRDSSRRKTRKVEKGCVERLPRYALD